MQVAPHVAERDEARAGVAGRVAQRPGAVRGDDDVVAARQRRQQLGDVGLRAAGLRQRDEDEDPRASGHGWRGSLAADWLPPMTGEGIAGPGALTARAGRGGRRGLRMVGGARRRRGARVVVPGGAAVPRRARGGGATRSSRGASRAGGRWRSPRSPPSPPGASSRSRGPRRAATRGTGPTARCSTSPCSRSSRCCRGRRRRPSCSSAPSRWPRRWREGGPSAPCSSAATSRVRGRPARGADRLRERQRRTVARRLLAGRPARPAARDAAALARAAARDGGVAARADGAVPEPGIADRGVAPRSALAVALARERRRCWLASAPSARPRSPPCRCCSASTPAAGAADPRSPAASPSLCRRRCSRAPVSRRRASTQRGDAAPADAARAGRRARGRARGVALGAALVARGGDVAAAAARRRASPAVRLRPLRLLARRLAPAAATRCRAPGPTTSPTTTPASDTAGRSRSIPIASYGGLWGRRACGRLLLAGFFVAAAPVPLTAARRARSPWPRSCRRPRGSRTRRSTGCGSCRRWPRRRWPASGSSRRGIAPPGAGAAPAPRACARRRGGGGVAAASYALPALAAREIERAVPRFGDDPAAACEGLEHARALNRLSDRPDVIAGALALQAGDPTARGGRSAARSAAIRATGTRMRS